MTAVALSCMSAPRAFAGKPEPLDTEFLDYLAACEGKDDDWTVIADGKRPPEAVDESPPASSKPPADEKAPAVEDAP